MSDKRNTTFPNNGNPSAEINTRYDGMFYESYIKHSHVNGSIESGGTTPIDITLMTGNGGNTEEGE